MSCTTFHHPTSQSYASLSKGARDILSTQRDAIIADFRAAIATGERAHRSSLLDTLQSMQTMLFKTQEMQQALVADFIDPRTSIIGRVEQGLTSIIDQGKKDVHEVVSAALDKTENMYNVFLKPNVNTVLRALKKEKTVLRGIASIIQNHHASRGRDYFVLADFYTYCQAQIDEYMLTGEPFVELQHLFKKVQGFTEIETNVEGVLKFYRVMRAVDSWKNYIEACRNDTNIMHMYLPHFQTKNEGDGLCSGPVSALLKYNNQIAQALNTTMQIAEDAKGLDNKQILNFAAQFYPLWDQFENVSRSVSDCFQEFSSLTKSIRNWMLDSYVDSDVPVPFSTHTIMPVHHLIRRFSDQLAKKYKKYMVGQDSKSQLVEWFNRIEIDLYTTLENLRRQTSQTLFTPFNRKLSETERVLGLLYNQGLKYMLSLSSYYNTTDVDVFKSVALTAEIWRTPQAQMDSVSVLSFKLSPEEAVSLAGSRIADSQLLWNIAESSEHNPYGPILGDYFLGLQARLLPAEETLFTCIHSAQASINDFHKLIEEFEAKSAADMEFLRYENVLRHLLQHNIPHISNDH